MGLGGWFLMLLSFLTASILQVSFMSLNTEYLHLFFPSAQEDRGGGGGGNCRERGGHAVYRTTLPRFVSCPPPRARPLPPRYSERRAPDAMRAIVPASWARSLRAGQPGGVRRGSASGKGVSKRAGCTGFGASSLQRRKERLEIQAAHAGARITVHRRAGRGT